MFLLVILKSEPRGPDLLPVANAWELSANYRLFSVTWEETMGIWYGYFLVPAEKAVIEIRTFYGRDAVSFPEIVYNYLVTTRL